MTEPEQLAQDLRALGQAAGLVAVGVTSAEPFDDVRAVLETRRDEGLNGSMAFTYRNPARSTDPSRTLPGARSLVVGALAYPIEVPKAPGESSGRVARYAADDYYGQLRDALEVIAGALRAQGWSARVLADDNALVDRAAAYRAGIGWYGKNSNLLIPGHGSWVVLGAVLTDAEVAPAPEPVADGCGSCRRCLDSCPTAAIVAPGVVDARRCLAWLVQDTGIFPRQYREALGDRIYGCDDCQEVCPPNRRHAPRTRASEGSWVDLVEMLGLNDEELLARHGRWYVPRREARYLRRNALVALGNTAPPSNETVIAALVTHLAHPDALVRAHAVWTARRLGHPELVDAVRQPEAPEVAEELSAPFPAPR